MSARPMGSNDASKRRQRPWAVLIGSGALVYLFWTQMLYPSYAARYTLTIEIETPSGLKTGSSVIEAVYGWEPTLFGLISGVRNRLYGEAVFVDLGAEKNLIVTLTNTGSKRGLHPSDRVSATDPMYLPSSVFGFPTHHKSLTKRGIQKAREHGTREVAPELLPTVVTFSDLSDPGSIKRVDPRDISKVLGSGYRLKSAKIQITDQAMMYNIEERLSWLPKHYNKLLDGKRIHTINAENGIANSLGSGAFKIKN